MKVVLVGGAEREARRLADALAVAGCGVCMVVPLNTNRNGDGAFQTTDTTGVVPETSPTIRIHRMHRADLHPSHWHKGTSAQVRSAWRSFLAEEQPDVVHVLHWQELSNELVLDAAREGVPAVVSLVDHYTTCLLATRIDPQTGAACEEQHGPHPCVVCASRVPPIASWVPIDQQYMTLVERREALARELRLARRRFVPSAQRGAELTRFAGGDLAYEVMPETVDSCDSWLAIYGAVVTEGPPGELPPEEWFEERMSLANEAAWDAACASGGVA